MSFAYFALFNVLTMYLTEDFGMSDATAGWVYGVHGLVAGCLSLAGGVATDCLGNQRSLITGSVLLACGYGLGNQTADKAETKQLVEGHPGMVVDRIAMLAP
eukprot:768735-Amphidinium_carterae.1